MTPHFVRTGYFDVLRTRRHRRTHVHRGRSASERARGDHRHAIAARKAFPGQPAAGKRVLARVVAAEEAERYDVVGVVEHQRRVTLAADGREGFFFPRAGSAPAYRRTLDVRTASAHPAIAAPAIRTERTAPRPVPAPRAARAARNPGPPLDGRRGSPSS